MNKPAIHDAPQDALGRYGASELRHIEVVAYRDHQGRPTCCVNWREAKACMFLGQRHFGSMAWCSLKHEEVLDYEESDFTKPLDGCPVWRQE